MIALNINPRKNRTVKWCNYTIEHDEYDGCFISYKKGKREWSSSFLLFECQGNDEVQLSDEELRTGDAIIEAYRNAGLY